ncbi:FAD-binding oxidoreductase [Caballeronia sp. LZ032]|uniref:NAD(P)/FAD-dependent oxidoreductase n=1 Tax=Caballeronia sp. LZ032 TaxID=3038565 RepID=UPI002858115B|nr:FAD-binding oxidoreductase [Caballeronia sp. LZ032]MDR5880303.1 FAD-binding oxidoreductase [Caballeronia sp. LZ032]
MSDSTLTPAAQFRATAPGELFPLAPSLWAHTAVPAVSTPALGASCTADVVIVGAGYAGLSTACHLAKNGVNVVVLEAREPGWGGSGRNGGQIIPGLKYDPDELEARFGAEAGRAVAAFAGSTTEHVFRMIDTEKLAVPHVRHGWVQGAHNDAALLTVESRMRQWERRGLKGAQLLDAAQVRNLLGTQAYKGGWLDPRAGGLQPLTYARELARVAMASGARIFGQTPVTGWQREGNAWKVNTALGPHVTARTVIVCTNAYTRELSSKLSSTVITPNSYQLSTAPLTAQQAESVMPGGQVSSDTRNLLLYFRKDHTGRLLMGGRGPFRQPASNNDWAHLERAVVKMFPQLAGIAFDHRWCGHVSVTRDFLPHVHEPEPGLLINIGCMGRGVALETAMGDALARYTLTRDVRALPFPLTRISPIPFHGLQRLYLAAVVSWYRMRDAGLL